MTHLLLLLFAAAGGLTLSGITANLYRILAPKPVSLPQNMVYYAVMTLAGPSVLFHNATRSFRAKACSLTAYGVAIVIAGYWSFALGMMILAVLR